MAFPIQKKTQNDHKGKRADKIIAADVFEPRVIITDPKPRYIRLLRQLDRRFNDNKSD